MTADLLCADIAQRIEATGFRAHGIHIRVGDGVAQKRWSADERRDIHSVSKGVCVLAAGIAADEGLISFDTPVGHYLPGFTLGAGVESVTLRHLLQMTSGIDLPWSETMMTDWPDLAREFLHRASRGRVFQYSNASTYTAMRVLEHVAGDVTAFLEARLFAPLGLTEVVWDRCPNGFILAGGGLHLRTEELSRLGKLVRDGGRWGDTRVVRKSSVDALHTGMVPAGDSPSYARYGLAGWAGPGDAWRLHGAYGQLLIFHGETVVTVTADDHFAADSLAEYVVERIHAHTDDAAAQDRVRLSR